MTEEKINPNVEKILTEITNLKAEIQKLKKTPSSKKEATKENVPHSTTEEKKEGHETIEDLINCPDCGPKARKLILEKLYKEHPIKHPVKCRECGIPIDQEEKECPNCGSTKGDRY